MSNINTAETTVTNTAWTFTRNSLTVNGCTCPATYSPAKDGTLYVFAGLMYPGADKATPVRLTLKPDMGELYALAMAAATTPAEPVELPAPAAEPEPVKPEPVPVINPDSAKVPEGYAPVVADGVVVAVERRIDLTAETPAPAEAEKAEQPAPVKPKRAPRKRSKAAPAEPEKAETPAAPAEAEPVEAPAPAPAAEPAPAEAAPAVKPWLGTVITGKGWTISFDQQVSRTCVRFEGEPSAAQKAAVDAAAFYYRRDLGCWVKKLTCKAHRAALALADELKALD